MSTKSRFRGPFHKKHGKWDQKVLISQMTQLLPCLLITVKAIKFEKVSLSDRQNLTTVF